MFVDPARLLYNAFGLKRSVAKVWSTSALVFYAEQKCAGRKLVAMFEEDDLTQMGGDFVFDKDGTLSLVYRSKVSTDRPSVEDLLKCAKEVNTIKSEKVIQRGPDSDAESCRMQRQLEQIKQTRKTPSVV